MNSILQQWNIFKKTWSHKIDKSDLFHDFDFFVTNKLYLYGKHERQYVVKKIYLSNSKVDKIFFDKETLHIYDSPFHIIIFEKKFPVGLILKSLLSTIIRYIENNSTTSIKIITSKFNNKEEEEEEEEEK